MIFSLFEMTIRMAPIDVLDYRTDGEVEARGVTGATEEPLADRRRATRHRSSRIAIAYGDR
jgi:hypothetical protein